MRQLTPKEKKISAAARKKANQVLNERRKEIGAKLRKISRTDYRYDGLLEEFDSIRDVKGCPVYLMLDGREIVVNYDLVRQYIRKLKRQQVSISIIESDVRKMLLITHQNWANGTKGEAVFYELPLYQRKLLGDLPLVDLTEELIT